MPNVEGIELDLIVILARMQRVEVGNTIDAKDDGLAVDHGAFPLTFGPLSTN